MVCALENRTARVQCIRQRLRTPLLVGVIIAVRIFVVNECGLRRLERWNSDAQVFDAQCALRVRGHTLGRSGRLEERVPLDAHSCPDILVRFVRAVFARQRYSVESLLVFGASTDNRTDYIEREMLR